MKQFLVTIRIDLHDSDALNDFLEQEEMILKPQSFSMHNHEVIEWEEIPQEEVNDLFPID